MDSELHVFIIWKKARHKTEDILSDLKKKSLLNKVEKYIVKIPRGDRTGVVIEPMLTDQWFVAMTKKSNDGKSISYHLF